MAKGLYGFITYPESIPTEGMQKWLESVLEVDYAYCLHDKDVNKDGKPKKEHVHWLIGYETGATTIKKLLKLFASRWFYYSSESVETSPEFVASIPDFAEVDRNVRAVEIPTGEAKPLIPRIVQMRSSQGAEDYLEHKNQPEKAQYTGQAHYSELWDVSKYLTYTEKRQAKKTDTSAEISLLLKTIHNSKARDYPALLDYLVEKAPELLPLAFQKAYAVEKYCRFRDVSEENAILRKDLACVQRGNAGLSAQISVLEKRNTELNAENRELRAEIERLQEKFASLALCYTEETGESPVN